MRNVMEALVEAMPAMQLGHHVALVGADASALADELEPLTAAWPVGQVSDYALSLDDGSRVHVQCFKDGGVVAHVDRFDPARGLLTTVAHLWFDTPVGPAVRWVSFALLLARLMR